MNLYQAIEDARQYRVRFLVFQKTPDFFELVHPGNVGWYLQDFPDAFEVAVVNEDGTFTIGAAYRLTYMAHRLMS